MDRERLVYGGGLLLSILLLPVTFFALVGVFNAVVSGLSLLFAVIAMIPPIAMVHFYRQYKSLSEDDTLTNGHEMRSRRTADETSVTNMHSTETGFVNGAQDYWENNGWRTQRHQIDDGVYLLAGTRTDDGETSKGLLLVLPNQEVTQTHLTYLNKKRSDTDATVSAIVSRAEYGETARKLADKYDVALMDPAVVISASDNALDTSNKSISFPDSG